MGDDNVAILNELEPIVVQQLHLPWEDNISSCLQKKTEKIEDRIEDNDQMIKIDTKARKFVFDPTQTLSIMHSPSKKNCNVNTTKSRRRKPKSVKMEEEVAVGLQSTLDQKFLPLKRSARRTKCSFCQK